MQSFSVKPDLNICDSNRDVESDDDAKKMNPTPVLASVIVKGCCLSGARQSF